MESSGDIELSLDITDFSLDGIVIHLNNIINIFILIFIYVLISIFFSENDARLSTRMEARNAMFTKGNKTAGIKV